MTEQERVEVEKLIEWEANNLARYIQHGSVERDDLLSVGWLTALTTKLGPIGAIRLRIRGAMKDALRRERRQLGRGGKKRQIFWPVYWPLTLHHGPGIAGHQGKRKPFKVHRCVDCREELDRGPAAKRCIKCAKIKHKGLPKIHYCMDCKEELHNRGHLAQRCIKCNRIRRNEQKRGYLMKGKMCKQNPPK